MKFIRITFDMKSDKLKTYRKLEKIAPKDINQLKIILQQSLGDFYPSFFSIPKYKYLMIYQIQ